MCDLKSQVWFQTHISRREVKKPLYLFHFQIAISNLSNKGFLVFFIDSALSWCVKSYQGRLSFFYNLIGFFNQAFKSDWLMRLSKTLSLAGKRCDLEQKVVWFRIYRTNGAFSRIWQKYLAVPCPLVTESYWTYCWIFLHTFYADICEKELPRNWSQVITVKIPKKIT